ncbi:hypothetical protein VE01_03245 [Pseudogymnoascus verrucosus]|uniref:TATA-binding protein interacting (TIP20) domain-containing protein n=1 Tax=Pseudogymnoascus verrucosus TaxID=342668 RepID=A0A1B8GSG6_9PEZI|nr:uncharacterized protein VE01_03245 [Pseudogymnoascus verrucosus]OBT98768.1 hypothetical protein VE01_03245 [Pseudogymnoascus verrucosus]
MSSTIPTNPNAQTVAALLPKLQDPDPDYRYMSLNDLFQVLTIGRPDFLYNDYNTAARAVDGIINTLDDQNGEVQNLAIKCLAPLVTKIPNTMLAPLIEKLSSLTTENSVDNSIPATALRMVVITLPRPVPGVAPTKEVIEAYTAMSRVLIPRLIGHLVVAPSGRSNQPAPPGMLQIGSKKEVDAEAVDVLIEVARCFGPMLQQPEVAALQEAIVGIIENEKASSVVKKRAVVAISILAVYLSDSSLSAFIQHLIESFRNVHITPIQQRLYITILGSMARSIPLRFGPYLKGIAPFVLSTLSQQELDNQLEEAADDGEPNPEVDDVREAALVALEAFISSCGNEMRLYTEEIISSAIRFLKYDPNYVDDDEDDEEMGGTQSNDDDDSVGDDDDFEDDAGFDDDDDDASWKVRRCASKVLYTLIGTRASGDLLEDGTLYSQVAPVLISRFNEREQNVRLEVISAMALLIRKTGEGSAALQANEGSLDYMSQPTSRKRRRDSSITFDTKPLITMSAGLTSPIIEPLPPSGPRADLSRLSPTLVKAVAKQLKGTSIPTKQAVINLLANLVSVQHGGLSEYFSQLVDPVVDAIKGTGASSAPSSGVVTTGSASATVSTLRVSALKLISDLCETHSSSVLQPFLPKIVPGVVSAVKDRYYKISAEAIVTVEQLVKALTPPRSRMVGAKHQTDIQNLYDVIINRVSSNDADLEVRSRAIHALGILLARTTSGDGAKLLSQDDRDEALQLLKDRLKNETTRIASVRAIDTVAALSTGKDQLKPDWVREVSLELAAQLRKADRSLRGASLAALKNLIVTPAARNSMDHSTISDLVASLLPLLNTNDLHLLGPALLVTAYLVEDDAKTVVSPGLNKALCDLLMTPLGGAVLDALLVLVKNIAGKGSGQPLMGGLLQEVSINGDPTVVGKVIGTLLVYGGPSVGVTIDMFIQELDGSSDDIRKSLALSVLGEATLRMGPNSPLKPETFMSHFTSEYTKLPLAAAVALGRAGAGNTALYLPAILNKMNEGGNTQYLLLHSIKEILLEAGSNSMDIGSQSKAIWDRLTLASQVEDNKAVGAECIGRLAILDPKLYMPKLQAYLQDPSPSIRAMGIQAIRYTLPDSDETFDAILKHSLIDMLTTMLNDTELENRRLALTTLNSAAHNKSDILLPRLGQLMPLVLRASVIQPELIREVMMGPFKHKVDDGLEVRKSAYETLYALMETSFSRINILDFYDRVIAGLNDEHDIRSLCNLMLTKLVVLDSEETARRLDSIAECFRTILSTKLKDNAVKQEIEKQDEARKGVLRVSLLLHNAIPAASSNMGIATGQHQTWRTFWEWVEKDYEPQLRHIRDEGRETGPTY